MAVKKPSTKGLGIYLALLLAFLLLATTLFSQSSTQQLIKYSKVLEYFENGQVSEFDLNLGSGNMTMLVEINGKKTEVNYRVPNVSDSSMTSTMTLRPTTRPIPTARWSMTWSPQPRSRGSFRCFPP